jgi:phage tail-like protein
MIARPRTDTVDPFTNTRFRVEIEGLRSTGASEVVFPEARIVRSARRAPTTRCGNLILKRGLTASADWYGWWDRARRSKVAPKAIVRVVLIAGEGEDAIRWTFRDVRPVAYHLSPLNALGSEVLMETLEATVGGFEADYLAANGDEPGQKPHSG